jgi:hypothetical protein
LSSIPVNTANQLDIQLEFFQALQISMTGLSDRIKIKFEDDRYFRDPETGKPL